MVGSHARYGERMVVDREGAARELVNLGRVEQVTEKDFIVHGTSGRDYGVTHMGAGKWRCTCPDHQYRQLECKHIIASDLVLSSKEKV